jgi:hypothetical protein
MDGNGIPTYHKEISVLHLYVIKGRSDDEV